MSKDIYRYYVYAYLRPDGTPYYIGKGCNKRAYKKHRHIPVPKDKSRIVFLETDLSNKGYKRTYKQIWITDGKINTRIKFDCDIPPGFRRGCTNKLAGEAGIEPAFSESKAEVLPLDDSPILL